VGRSRWTLVALSGGLATFGIMAIWESLRWLERNPIRPLPVQQVTDAEINGGWHHS